MAEYATHDNGQKQVFPTGAQRNAGDGKGHYEDVSPIMMERLAKLLERGANIYGSLNYAKGMPMMRTMQSLLRHAYNYLEGKRDEDHLAAVVFNAMVLMHTEAMILRGRLPKELDNMPDYTPKPEKAEKPTMMEDSTDEIVRNVLSVSTSLWSKP